MNSHSGSMSGPGMHHPSPNADPGSWSGQDYSGNSYGSTTPNDSKSPSGGGGGFLKGFQGIQKKVTRDGQPAKRRGPKPDSKPAQTRRQELNRQAQRTHRERKEQYIKALELELARLRETFVNESRSANRALEQQKLMINDQQRENNALRDILATRGIQYEQELESRKMALKGQSRAQTSSLSPPQLGARPVAYQNVLSGPPSSTGYSPIHHQMYNDGGNMTTSRHSPNTTHGNYSSPGSDIQEYAIKQEPGTVPDMPGVFEKDPQLSVDFILSLEQTCRDHEEFLVRRSVQSPDNPEEALFSGHALMASCPPPSHIERVPAQGDGLIPTYDHKVPDTESIRTLNNLLNLSQSLRADDLIAGGQVTPIMALQSLKNHRSYSSLTREDVVNMIKSIKGKVRCYGFGAVMEDFELRDALSEIFATKSEDYESYREEYTDDLDNMYS